MKTFKIGGRSLKWFFKYSFHSLTSYGQHRKCDLDHGCLLGNVCGSRSATMCPWCVRPGRVRSFVRIITPESLGHSVKSRTGSSLPLHPSICRAPSHFHLSLSYPASCERVSFVRFTKRQWRWVYENTPTGQRKNYTYFETNLLVCVESFKTSYERLETFSISKWIINKVYLVGWFHVYLMYETRISSIISRLFIWGRKTPMTVPFSAQSAGSCR